MWNFRNKRNRQREKKETRENGEISEVITAKNFPINDEYKTIGPKSTENTKQDKYIHTYTCIHTNVCMYIWPSHSQIQCRIPKTKSKS